MKTNVEIGKKATVNITVTEKETARAVGSGSAEVFATPMMVALMERAACEVLSDVLEDSETSVGTHISVSHNAATVIGSNVTATATITSIEGRKIEFSVSANDSAGEIGCGTHTRVVLDEEKFMAKAKERNTI